MAELSTLARPYAKAAFEYADAAGQLDEWSQQLALAAAVASDEAMQQLLGSPSLTAEQVVGVFIDVCADGISDPVKNLLKVLADNKRLPLLPQIRRLFDERKAAKQHSMKVTVASAKPLDDASLEKLAASLRRKLDAEIQMDTRIDESLLGGVLIRAGDTVIDGSVKGRLAKLAEALNSQA